MQQTALITGASSGIGKAFAKLCAMQGWDLVLVSRNEEKLHNVAQSLNVHCTIMPCDLSKPGGPAAVCTELENQRVEVSILFNCAGFGSHGPFATLDLEKELNMINLNVRSLIALTGLLLPKMIERGNGRILNVASTAAFEPGPYMATYFASKAAVLSFSEALWQETRGTGVSVTCLCPGPTTTEFDKRADLKNSKLFSKQLATPEAVAMIGMRALLSGKRIQIVGLRNQFLVFLAKILPRRLVLRGSSYLLKK
jgi:short-subunit dehydrogenase